MRQKELEKWLKIVIIAVALCGLVVCAVAIPWIGHVLIAPDPQISDMYIVLLPYACLKFPGKTSTIMTSENMTP